MASNNAPLCEKIETPPGFCRFACDVLKPIETGWCAL
jgi:hypothetical protein